MAAPQATRWLRLPPVFAQERLLQDLQQVQQQRWLDHYNQQAHQGAWRCLPLRSAHGATDHILAEADCFLDTAVLNECPYFQEVLASFACEKTSVRLMSLAAGARILPHRDPGGGFEDGVARLHIPLRTAPEVIFTLDGEELHFAAGQTWYMNANCLHAVRNDSAIERVHLVIDCVPNDWLRAMFCAAGWQPNPPPKYGDPAITDHNVADVIRALRQVPDVASQQLANRLAQQAGLLL